VRVLPPQLADVCWRAYETAGVALSCESTVVQVTPHPGGGHVVQTDDGRETTADSVVVALGGVPNSGWLSSSGLSLGDGIDCDEHGRTSIDGVFAVGDVARWHNNFLGRPQRVEQWESAREHALVVSRQILGVEGEGLSAPPYFWSDLLAGRVQFAGWYDAGVDDVWNFTDERGRVLALTGSGDRLSGVFTSRFPRAMARGRDLLRDGASLGEALTWAEATLPAVVPDMV
jgi:NADPH-dependent 2,4-dienoyl-CoA reductase/sulfur reductase-like enzyme